jgi:uncharacterized small protein (DUF1192 family)
MTLPKKILEQELSTRETVIAALEDRIGPLRAQIMRLEEELHEQRVMVVELRNALEKLNDA